MSEKRITIINNMFINLARYNLSFEFFNYNEKILLIYQTYRNIIEIIYKNNPNLIEDYKHLYENKDEYFYKNNIIFFREESDFEMFDDKLYKDILNKVKNDEILNCYNPSLCNVDSILKNNKKYKTIIRQCKSDIKKVFVFPEKADDINFCGASTESKSISSSCSDNLVFGGYNYNL